MILKITYDYDTVFFAFHSKKWTRAPTVVLLSFTGYSVGTIRSVLSFGLLKGHVKDKPRGTYEESA